MADLSAVIFKLNEGIATNTREIKNLSSTLIKAEAVGVAVLESTLTDIKKILLEMAGIDKERFEAEREKFVLEGLLPYEESTAPPGSKTQRSMIQSFAELFDESLLGKLTQSISGSADGFGKLFTVGGVAAIGAALINGVLGLGMNLVPLMLGAVGLWLYGRGENFNWENQIDRSVAGMGIGTGIGGIIGFFLGGPIGAIIGSLLGGIAGALIGYDWDNFVEKQNPFDAENWERKFGFLKFGPSDPSMIDPESEMMYTDPRPTGFEGLSDSDLKTMSQSTYKSLSSLVAMPTQQRDQNAINVLQNQLEMLDLEMKRRGAAPPTPSVPAPTPPVPLPKVQSPAPVMRPYTPHPLHSPLPDTELTQGVNLIKMFTDHMNRLANPQLTAQGPTVVDASQRTTSVSNQTLAIKGSSALDNLPPDWRFYQRSAIA